MVAEGFLLVIVAVLFLKKNIACRFPPPEITRRCRGALSRQIPQPFTRLRQNPEVFFGERTPGSPSTPKFRAPAALSPLRTRRKRFLSTRRIFGPAEVLWCLSTLHRGLLVNLSARVLGGSEAGSAAGEEGEEGLLARRGEILDWGGNSFRKYA